MRSNLIIKSDCSHISVSHYGINYNHEQRWKDIRNKKIIFDENKFNAIMTKDIGQEYALGENIYNYSFRFLNTSIRLRIDIAYRKIKEFYIYVPINKHLDKLTIRYKKILLDIIYNLIEN